MNNNNSNTNNLQYFQNNINENDNNHQQLKRKLLERLEVEEFIKEEGANKKQITENMIKEMENLSIRESNKQEDMDIDIDYSSNSNSRFNKTSKSENYYLEDFFDSENNTKTSESIKLPNNKVNGFEDNNNNIKLVIPDSILKIGKPLPEILFKNASRGKELVLYRPIQWPWNKKNNNSFKPSFTPLIEEIDEDEDMFESDDIPPPSYCLNHSYPTSIIEPYEATNNQTDFNSNDADDEDSIIYCQIHDAYHPSGCYQSCCGSLDNVNTNNSQNPSLGGGGVNSFQFINNGINRGGGGNGGLFNDDDNMDCSL